MLEVSVGMGTGVTSKMLLQFFEDMEANAKNRIVFFNIRGIAADYCIDNNLPKWEEYLRWSVSILCRPVVFGMVGQRGWQWNKVAGKFRYYSHIESDLFSWLDGTGDSIGKRYMRYDSLFLADAALLNARLLLKNTKAAEARKELIRLERDFRFNEAFHCNRFLMSCGESLDTYEKLLELGCENCKRYAAGKLRERELIAVIADVGPGT